MTKDILKILSDSTKERIEFQKRQVSLAEIKCRAQQAKSRSSFLKALNERRMSCICEVKKASPSKGLIARNFPYLKIAKEYEEAGASAISVLTEPKYFLGNDKFLAEISEEVRVPVLRKDFTIDEYMIYQAKVLGASAVLLIVSLLDEAELKSYRQLSENLGMDALVEAHSKAEIEVALKSGAKIIGVNNRNLKNFDVDPTNSTMLRKFVPSDVIFVSESGIKTADDVKALKDSCVDAVLIGETMMRSCDKKSALKELGFEEKI
ncbi:indole-3-glycerol phosphate synthase TrpC [Ligilactobacillus ruminis]|jgi:indole-3-glycerol phosphate synthase|uniref:indole-3-glycerol phosphate synthase TrpC n=1 Tax=Ligilactobacillus ruminis TaxID=1623 RepID=UPI0022E8EE09|nr:indole-3-glycerol phosphate synthase TrpC [Ligilactobacillus ruminis]